MTREDIIRMAREAGIDWHKHWNDDESNRLERFAALVAADERNRLWTQKHWTEYERSIVAAEREACAQIAEDFDACDPKHIAAAIRARGKE